MKTERPEDLNPEYMTLQEAAHYIRASERKIPLFRKYGMLKFTRFGRSFVYKKSWCDDFSEEWAGYDLGNERKIQAAIAEKAWRKKHGYE